jgi:hypothetical protein
MLTIAQCALVKGLAVLAPESPVGLPWSMMIQVISGVDPWIAPEYLPSEPAGDMSSVKGHHIQRGDGAG